MLRTEKADRKILFVLLMAVVIFMAASIAGAAETHALSGEGTEDKPYYIDSMSDWDEFAADVKAGNSEGKYYGLNDNIVATTPVGTKDHPFEGYFSGRGYKITADISDMSSDGTALFQYINNAEIKTLTVDGTIRGSNYAAGLVGFILPEKPESTAPKKMNKISEVFISATVNSGNNYVSGIVGAVQAADITLENCWFSGSITGREYISGLLGRCSGSRQNITIKNCLFSGSYKCETTSVKFHPIGTKVSYSIDANLTVDGAYYGNTTPPEMNGYNSSVLTNDIKQAYAKADIDASLGHFNKAVLMTMDVAGGNEINTEYYYPIDEFDIKLNKTFYQHTDSSIRYDVTADGKTLSGNTDYTADMAFADSPNIQVTESEALAHADPYIIVVNGKNNYLGKMATHFVVTDITGSGTESSPYMINNVSDWNQFGDILVTGKGETFAGKFVKLGNNITVTNPLGSESHPFSGTFDGQNKTITCNINATGQGAAPFRAIKGATIKNITSAGTVKGEEHSAGLVGFALGESKDIVNRIDHVAVTANVTANNYVAGVVGHGKNSTVEITNSIYSGKASGSATNTRYTGAGFLGWADDGALRMSNCINKGSIGSKFYWWSPIAREGHINVETDVDTTYYVEGVAKGTDTNVYPVNIEGTWLVKTSAPSGTFSSKIRAVDNNTYYIDEGVKITGIKPVYAYTGSEITLAYKVVKADGTELRKDTDYTVNSMTVKDKKNYTLTVTGKGDYTGSVSAKFKVADWLNGSGTEEDPYIISNTSDWDKFTTVNNGGYTYKGEFVKLTADISSVKTMAGTETYPFEGKFDGGGHTITAAISSSSDGTAPFSNVRGVTIKNLTVAGTITGGSWTSGLIGYVRGCPVNISNVEVKATVKSAKHLGGFIGHSLENYYITITDSIFSGELNATGSEGYIGGFAGWADRPGYDIRNCLFSGRATGKIKLFNPAGIYYAYNTGYMAMNGGKVYYTSSGAPAGSQDSYALILKDWNVSTVKAYSYDEAAGDYENLYKPLVIGGKETEYFEKVSSSELVTDKQFILGNDEEDNDERANIDLKIIVDGKEVNRDYFKVRYYLQREDDLRTEYFENEIHEPGEYLIEAEGKGEQYSGHIYGSFKVIRFAGNGTEDNPYNLYNTEDWVHFTEALAGGHTFEGEHLILGTSDIHVLVPAGTEQYPFKGTIDGIQSGGRGNQTLHLELDDTAASGLAPFRYVADGAVIKNIDTDGTVKGGIHSAGLVGFALNGKVEIGNAHVSAEITDGTHVGGIVGHGKQSSLTITDSAYTGRITGGSSFAGGLLGWSDGQKLTMERCIFSGQFMGTGSFHPVAVRYNNSKMTTNVRRVYYRSTQAPDIPAANAAASGTPVYTNATYPQDKLVSTVNAADGNAYYAEANVGTLEAAYNITPEGIAPVPTVSDVEGNQLLCGTGKDYTVTYYKVQDITSPLEVITDVGEYIAVLKGNGSNTLGQQTVQGTFMAESNHVTSVSLNKTEAVLNFDEDENTNTVQLEETVEPVTATNKKVNWTSSDENVATVDENGLVTAKGTGTAVITATAADTTHGTISAACNVTVEKSQAKIIIFPSVNPLTYNGKTQQLINPGSVSGGTMVYRLGETGEYTNTIPTAINAGDYSVWYKVIGDDEHTGTPAGEEHAIISTIAKAQGGAVINNKATLKTRVENFDLNTLVTGDKTNGVTFAIKENTNGSKITDGHLFTAGASGTCIITATVAERDNYAAQTEDITITIESKDIGNINITIGNWTYGEPEKEPTYSIVGTPDGEIKNLTIMYAGTKRNGEAYGDNEAELNNPPVDAGIYSVYVYCEDDSKIYFNGQEFMILPKSIEGAVVTLGDSLTYTGIEQKQEVSKVELGGQDITSSCSFSGNTATNAGNHTLVVTAKETSNYTGTVNKEFSVAKADPVVQEWPKAIEGLVYNGSMQVLIEPGLAYGGVMRYNYGAGFSEKLPVACDAGPWLVTYMVQGDSNHNNLYIYSDSEKAIHVDIAPAVCTVDTVPEAVSGLKYTSEDQALITAGASADGDMLYRLGDDESAQFSAEIPKAKNAGEYKVYYKAAARDDNHTDSLVSEIAVTIGKENSEIIKTPEAVQDLTYDGEEHALITAGEVNGGTILYSLERDGIYTETIPAAVNADKYKVYYKISGGDNYTDSDVMGPVLAEIKPAAFPGKISRYGISADFGEDVDMSGFVESDEELEYEILLQDPEDLGCHLTGSVLTTGSSSGKCYVDVKVKGDSGNYETENIYVNVSNIQRTEINVSQDDVVYGRGKVEPEYDEHGDESQITALAISYTGIIANGEKYGDDEEELNTAPAEAGSYTARVYYMIGNRVYEGETEFSIRPADIKDADVTLDNEIRYDGTEQTQEVAKVEYAGQDITDLCEVSDNKATKAGNYELTLTPKKEAYNFNGTAKVKFIVYPDDATLEAAKKAAIKELEKKYKPSDYTGAAKKAVTKALADAKKAINKAETLDEIEAAKKAATKAIAAAKKKNTIKAKGKTIKAKYSKVKKKTLKFKKAKAAKVTKAVGKVTYKRVKVKAKKSLLKQAKKKIKIAKSGKVTIKKGLKKGTYKLVVKVRAAGNKYYKAGTKKVTITIKVK